MEPRRIYGEKVYSFRDRITTGDSATCVLDRAQLESLETTLIRVRNSGRQLDLNVEVKGPRGYDNRCILYEDERLDFLKTFSDVSGADLGRLKGQSVVAYFGNKKLLGVQRRINHSSD